MWENTDQINSEYRLFSGSDIIYYVKCLQFAVQMYILGEKIPDFLRKNKRDILF